MKKKIEDIENWSIILRRDSYQIFKKLAMFEDGTRVCDNALTFCDEDRSIIFTGKLVSYMDCIPGGAFNFIIGSEKKWLRMYHPFVEKINGIDARDLIEYEEVISKRTIPKLLECMEIIE